MVQRSKIIQIGNSRGVRIPKPMLSRAGLDSEVTLEEREGGIFIRSARPGKLSWEETYKEMAASNEDWSDWTELDITALDED
ncbi:MAG: AbrB/MazE/SpoVT family DNA-binding domain-containing protein [Verrucomicrobiota bacterium]